MTSVSDQTQYGDPDWGDPSQVACWRAALSEGHDLRHILLNPDMRRQFFPEPALASALRYLEGQKRGGEANYEQYYRGMDITESQKIALAAAYLPSKGVIADMGSGSGRGTFSIASLYPELFAVGVDITERSVAHASSTYQRENLAYVLGDITQNNFPPNSLDAILDISVLHHVTSFNNFDTQHLERLLDNQVKQLKPGGRLIIRDFVIADWPAVIKLSLTNQDGEPSGPIETLSTAAAFTQFAVQFRSSEHPNSNVPRILVKGREPNFVNYELLARDAQEFLLHKDYRLSWEAECREEYLYWTQNQFLDALNSRGLRVIYAVEIHNPWIERNRFDGKVKLADKIGRPLEYPPTNFIIVGEKVAQAAGVDLNESSHQSGAQFDFCKISAHHNTRSGEIFEMVSRPNQTAELVLWRRDANGIRVILKDGYPRPLINAATDSPNLDKSYRSGYVSEPITQIILPGQSMAEVLESALMQRAHLDPARLIGEPTIGEVLTSPGGIDEKLIIVEQEIGGAEVETTPLINYSGFSTSGSVKELDAQQLLRTCQVGGVVDNRLELAVYRILSRLGIKLDPWIADSVALQESGKATHAIEDVAQLFGREARSVFEETALNGKTSFLDLRKGIFEERDQQGHAISQRSIEYVTPKDYSDNTLSVLPVKLCEGELLVGLEERDLPAAQNQFGNSRIITAPAFRLKRYAVNLALAKDQVKSRMRTEFGLEGNLTPLGGKYYTSLGACAEVCYPQIMSVSSQAKGELHWVRAKDLLSNLDLIKDGHLATLLLRAMHCLRQSW